MAVLVGQIPNWRINPHHLSPTDGCKCGGRSGERVTRTRRQFVELFLYRNAPQTQSRRRFPCSGYIPAGYEDLFTWQKRL